VFTRSLFIAFAIAFTVSRAPAQQPPPRAVRLTTADDVGIAAAFYPATTNPAPGVILVHDYGKNRDEWSSFIPGLRSAGFAVLSFDLRGHGESTRRLTAEGPKVLDYQNFNAHDFQDMLLDLEAAYDWLVAQSGVDKSRVALVGAGLGANLALRYGAFNDEIRAFLLFSPAFVYQNVRTDDVIAKLRQRPVRICVSQFDAFSYESCKRLIDLHIQAGNPGGTNDLTVCSGSNHGAQMLANVKQLPGITIVWLKQALKSPAPVK
jgi:alpha-beta hydrolase superfamily lysophospholipase